MAGRSSAILNCLSFQDMRRIRAMTTLSKLTNAFCYQASLPIGPQAAIRSNQCRTEPKPPEPYEVRG